MTTKSITVRDVPTDVHGALVAHAARRGQSLQEYLLSELTRTAGRPSTEELLERIRRRLAVSQGAVTRESILAHRDADRR